jgi:hypothetical protein
MKPKRILIITDLPVWPPNAGNKTRVWALMNNLRNLGHEISFLGLGLAENEAEAMREQWPDVHNLPKIRARHAKPRWFALWRVLTDGLIARGIGSPGVDHWFWPHWDKAIAEYARTHHFDVVIAEYVFFSRALVHFGDDVLKVVDTHDVYTGRREKLKERNIKRFYQYLTDEKEEIRGLERADVVMSIQENESQVFRRMLGESRPVVTVGHTVEPQPLPLPHNRDMLFVGSPYTANVDGLMHFVTNCLPGIRAAVPGSRLIVAGSICRVLPNDLPGVKLLGPVEDLATAYSTVGVVINPVLTGSGLKTKTVEALAYRRALVTTPCGAEGLEEAAGEAFCVAHDDAQFTTLTIALLTHRALVSEVATCGVNFITRWNAAQVDALQSILTETKNHETNPHRSHLSPEPVAEVGDLCGLPSL